MADELCVEGPDYLLTPSPESMGTGHLRVRCRPSHTLAQDIAIHKMPFGPLARKLKGNRPVAKDLTKPKQDLPAKPSDTQVPGNGATSLLVTQNTVLAENDASEDSTCFKDSAEPSQGTDLVPSYSMVLSHIFRTRYGRFEFDCTYMYRE